VGGVWIFSGTAHYKEIYIVILTEGMEFELSVGLYNNYAVLLFTYHD